jgi:uncharacterized membrane protein
LNVLSSAERQARHMLESLKENRSFRKLATDPEYKMIMLSASAFFIMSALLHFPGRSGPPLYSDLINVFWYQRPWILTGIPYINYMFEYPPLCGLILWAGAWGSAGSVDLFAIIEFAILFTFTLLMTHVLYLFMEYLGIDHGKQLTYVAFAPSFLIYGVYNFDIVQAALVTFALYLFIAKRRMDSSALALGLSIATKTAPALLVPLFLQDLKGREARVRFLSIVVIVALGMNLPFMLLNFQIWLSGYQFIRNWGLEDTFLVWVFGNSSTWAEAKQVSLILTIVGSLLVYALARKKPLIVRSFLIIGIFILFSYIATPQMNLDLLPFFALVPIIPYTVFLPFEIFNVGIILTWFSFNNSELPGVPQAFALLRQVYLFFILFILWSARTFNIGQKLTLHKKLDLE